MLVAVPCSGDDCVVLLDADSGSERGRVPVGSHPVHLADVGGRVFVATMGDRAVSVVSDGEVTRVETGVLGPSHFAVCDDGDVLVPCTGGDALAVVDSERLELRHRVGVGGEPHDVAVRGGLAFVGSRAEGTVTVVDPSAATVVATHALGSNARVQGVEATAEAVYAVDQRNARLVRLTEAGVTGSVSVGANPYDAVLEDGRAFVPGRDDGTVTVADTALTNVRVHDLGGRPVGVAAAGGREWVLDRDRSTLSSLDGRTVDLAYPAFAGATAAAEPRSYLYVAHYDDDAVSAVDLEAEQTAWTTSTPSHPFEPLAV